MGHVILPSGASEFVDGISGSVNLSQLIHDMTCEDYTESYRISVIAAIGKLRRKAVSAVTYLNDMIQANGATGLIGQAAKQALQKINDLDTTQPIATTTPNATTPNATDWSRRAGGVGSRVTDTRRPEVHRVTFTELEPAPLDQGLKTYSRCVFCQKLAVVTPLQRRHADRLSGSDRFFCNFCLRNDNYLRSNTNVMVMTYRGLIGYYYYSFYVAPKTSAMYVMDIQDYIDLHIRAGLTNPAFRYDPETYCWFVDFAKVGRGKRKLPVEAVLETIIQQLAVFNIYDNVRESSPRLLYEKYRDAVNAFHHDRTRINGDQIFAPTLWGCNITTRCPAGTRPIPVTLLREFLPSNLVNDHYRGTRRY